MPERPLERPRLGVVIGHGSVGRHHSSVLADRYERIAIVDPNDAARAAAQEAHPGAVVAASLEELARSWELADSVAVIATWGPSHADVFAELVDLGTRHVVCEKPLTSSVADGAAMVELAERAGVRLGVHMQRRYSGIVEGLLGLADELDLGPMVGAVVQAGARCLVTNGIHYLDMVSALFGASPERVIGSALGEPMNPRSPDLEFYGGTAVWAYPGGRECTMVMSNLSSVAERTHLYFRDAVVDLSPAGEIGVLVRRAEDVLRFPSITRTGVASEVRFQGAVPGLLDPPLPTVRLLEEVEGDGPQRLTPAVALEAVGACIGALAAGESRTSIDLPIDPGSELGQRVWPMS